MMSDPMPTIYISLVYLFIVTVLCQIMKRTKEFNFKFIIFCYNVMSIFLNIYISAQIILIKYEVNDFKLCTKINAQNPFYLNKVSDILNFGLFSF